MTSENFKKLLPIVEQWNKDNADTGIVFGWYKSWDIGHYIESYEEQAYCMYYKDQPTLLMDICEYIDDGGKELIVPQKTWKYPNLKKEHTFPLKSVSMLGHRTWTQAVPEIPLNDMYGNWKSYDPVAWILSKLYHPQTLEKMCEVPVPPVIEVTSIKDGLGLQKPFMIKNFSGNAADAFKTAGIESCNLSESILNTTKVPLTSATGTAAGCYLLNHSNNHKNHNQSFLFIPNSFAKILTDEKTGKLKEQPTYEYLFLSEPVPQEQQQQKEDRLEESIPLWGNMYHAWVEPETLIYFPSTFFYRYSTYTH
jgi:hypothetical protein